MKHAAPQPFCFPVKPSAWGLPSITASAPQGCAFLSSVSVGKKPWPPSLLHIHSPHPDPLHEPSLGPLHTRALSDHASAQKRPHPPQALPALSTQTGGSWWFSVRHVCCEFKSATTGGADDTPNKIALLQGNSVQLLALPLAVIFKFQILHQV